MRNKKPIHNLTTQPGWQISRKEMAPQVCHEKDLLYVGKAVFLLKNDEKE